MNEFELKAAASKLRHLNLIKVLPNFLSSGRINYFYIFLEYNGVIFCYKQGNSKYNNPAFAFQVLEHNIKSLLLNIGVNFFNERVITKDKIQHNEPDGITFFENGIHIFDFRDLVYFIAYKLSFLIEINNSPTPRKKLLSDVFDFSRKLNARGCSRLDIYKKTLKHFGYNLKPIINRDFYE